MRQITPEELTRNPFQMIGKDWLMLTAKSGDRTNTMTASWGGVGIMWGKPVAYIFVRPQRFTKTLIDAENRFSISVLPESNREQMRYFGSASGFNEDKIAKAGLPLAECEGVPYYQDSEIAMIVKKLYAQPMSGAFLTEEGKPVDERWYPNQDWHTMYVAVIEKVFVK